MAWRGHAKTYIIPILAEEKFRCKRGKLAIQKCRFSALETAKAIAWWGDGDANWSPSYHARRRTARAHDPTRIAGRSRRSCVSSSNDWSHQGYHCFSRYTKIKLIVRYTIIKFIGPKVRYTIIKFIGLKVRYTIIKLIVRYTIIKLIVRYTIIKLVGPKVRRSSERSNRPDTDTPLC